MWNSQDQITEQCSSWLSLQNLGLFKKKKILPLVHYWYQRDDFLLTCCCSTHWWQKICIYQRQPGVIVFVFFTLGSIATTGTHWWNPVKLWQLGQLENVEIKGGKRQKSDNQISYGWIFPFEYCPLCKNSINHCGVKVSTVTAPVINANQCVVWLITSMPTCSDSGELSINLTCSL